MLDDSTSAVDTKTDALIRKAFREEIPDTTKIIIAQRISSVQDADAILVLDDGRIEAASVPGNSFCGWYAVDGTLLSTNVEINRNDFDGVNDFIAKFTASTPGGVGDVDGDGVVRVSDAVLIMRYALGLIEFTPEQILCGDVDGDGFVKVADAVMVIRIALGLV